MSDQMHFEDPQQGVVSRDEDLLGAGRMTSPSVLNHPTVDATNSGYTASGADTPECSSSPPLGGADVGMHVRHLISAVRDAYGFTPDKRHTFANLCARWRDLDRQQPLEKVLKWFYGLGLAIVTGETDLPPGPLPELSDWRGVVRQILGSGRLGRFWISKTGTLRKAFQSGKPKSVKRALSWGQTWLLLKKGSPVVSERLQQETAEKHRKALEDPVKGVHASLRDVRVEKDVIRDDEALVEIRRTTRELFGNVTFELGSDLDPFPSTSGHYKTKRTKGGAAGLIAELWMRSKFPGDQTGYAPSPTTTKIRLESGEDVVVRSFEGQEERFLERVSALLDEEELEPPAVPIQVLEPLKVRTVTCGPEIAYWLVVSIQKWMWKVLRKYPTFELIGRPIDDMVMDRLLALSPSRESGTAFLSGDFSAATDNVRACFSEACWNEICDCGKIPDWIRSLGRACLVGHRLFPSRLATYEESFLQRNGQLMGSPLSFPILCVLNASVARQSFVSRPLRERSLKDLPIKINGDDCGMIYTRADLRRWEHVSAGYGLEPSVGKCYYSSKFIQLNSELFQLRTCPLGRKYFERVPFWNMSLLNDRSSKGDEKRSFLELGTLCRDFVRSITIGWCEKKKRDGLQEKAVSIFIKRQQEMLKSVFDISWWLPKSLGGLGLPAKKKTIASRLTPAQHQLASQLFMMTKKEGRMQYPFGRWELAQHPWLAHALRKTELFESQRVFTEDPVFGWDLLGSEPSLEWSAMGEGESFWSLTERLDQYGPVLWNEANMKTWPAALSEAKERLKERGKAWFEDACVAKFWTKGEEEGAVERLKQKILREKWRQWRSKSERTNVELVPIEDLLRPLRTSTITSEDVSRLRAVVSAPRGTLASILAPWSHVPFTPDPAVLAEICFTNEWRRNYALISGSPVTD